MDKTWLVRSVQAAENGCPEAAPVISCEALRGVSVPDTKIDSATLQAADGSCRVTATVVHPPADNHIRVFIALPIKGWNGRFQGTGGGGYAGKGYAVGATGNPAGTANFALGPDGKGLAAHAR